MNLFEKIAKENDNSGLVNTGLSTATLGGLGLTGHSLYKTHKHNSEIKELEKEKEKALKDSKYYEQNLNKLKANKDDFIAKKRKEYELMLLSDDAKKEAQKAYDMEVNMREQASKSKLNDAIDLSVKQKGLKENIKRLGRNSKLGLAAAGLGAAGLGYNLYKDKYK